MVWRLALVWFVAPDATKYSHIIDVFLWNDMSCLVSFRYIYFLPLTFASLGSVLAHIHHGEVFKLLKTRSGALEMKAYMWLNKFYNFVVIHLLGSSMSPLLGFGRVLFGPQIHYIARVISKGITMTGMDGEVSAKGELQKIK